MIKHLPPEDYLRVLGSPSANEKLEHRGKELVCAQSGMSHPIRNLIIEFVDAGRLDAEKARELQGNTIAQTPDVIELYANKHTWSEFYSHFTNLKIRRLIKFLRRVNCERLVALGCGTGYELRHLLGSGLSVKTIFASDLSYTMLSVVPHTLKTFDVELCLFTSDLDDCPVQATDIPVLIYEALHHTGDMHATIRHLMSRSYENILFVEPTTNLVMRYFEKRGLARRVEYSGVKPDRLVISKLKTLCREFGYRMARQSLWEMPEDHFRKICPRPGKLQTALLASLNAIGTLATPVIRGNTSIVHLRRTSGSARNISDRSRVNKAA